MNRISVKVKTIALNRSKNANELAKHRRACRNDAFSMGRNLGAADAEDIIEEEEIEVNDKVERAQIADSRRHRLEKWKEEKTLKKKSTQVSQKPVFKTGIVHHSVGSPNLFKTSIPAQAPKPVASKHTVSHHNAKSPLKEFVAPRRGAQTRNMAKQTAVTGANPSSSNAMIVVPMNTKFKPPKGLTALGRLTVPHTPKSMMLKKLISGPIAAVASPQKKVATANVVTTSQRKKMAAASVVTISPRKKVATANVGAAFSRKKIATTSVVTTSPQKKVAIASKGATSPRKRVNAASVAVASPLKRVAITTPIVSSASPAKRASTVLTFCGSTKTALSASSSQKEAAVATPGALAQQMDVVNTLLTNSDGTTGLEEQRGPIYFRNLLDCEVTRLNSLCDKWSSNKTSLPETASEDILSRFDVAIGQTQLLIRSKLNQFRGLTHDCERGDCNPPIHCDDLQGFWEMVHIQIEGMDKLFAELAELEASNWQEKPRPAAAKRARALAAAKPAAKPAAGRAGNNIRAMIAAARKKQLEEQNKLEEKFAENTSAMKLRDPRIEEIKATPVDSSKRRSLLKQVLSDTAARRVIANSPIIMKVSQQAKRSGSFVGDGAQASTSTAHVETYSHGDTSVAWMQPAPVPPSSILSSSSRLRTGRTLRQSVMHHLKEGNNHFRRSMATYVGESNLTQGKENAAATLNSSIETPTQAIVKNLAALNVANDAIVPCSKTLSASKSPTSVKCLRRSKVGTSARAPTPAKTPKGYKKTSQNRASNVVDRVSLLPCQNEASPICLASSMDDLISFDTPVRRSTRIARL